jgi:hypothetical protein
VRKVCLLRDLAEFIDACDIRATANASRELPGMLAKSSSEQSRRCAGQHEQLTLAAGLIHRVRGQQLAVRGQPFAGGCCRMHHFSSAQHEPQTPAPAKWIEIG